MNLDGRTRPLNISNLLSLSRIFLVIPIILFLEQNTPSGNLRAFGCMVLAGVTDWLDGYLARRFQQTTVVGRIIDPLADKITVGAIAIYLTWRRDFPMWFLLLILARDFVILAIGLLIASRRRGVPEADWFGKVAVTGLAVMLIIYALELTPLKAPLLMVSVALLGLSSASYFERFRKEFLTSGTNPRNS